jgi:DNA-binding SARP family transcriptional activator
LVRIIARIPRLAAAATVRLTKLTLLTALVAGIPYGLLTQIGSPLPRHPPTPDELGGLLTTPVSETLVLALLADALWILWAAFTISVAAELVAAIRGTPAPGLPTVAPMQALAGWLITGVTVGTLVSAPLTTGVPLDPPPAVAATVESQPSGQTYDRMLLHSGNATVTVAPAAATTNEMIVLVGSQRHTVTVARGDNLSHLARDWLGDADRWPEIYQLNAGRSFPDVGGRLTNPNLIYPGWVLDLPADARPPGPAASQPTDPAPATASPSPPHEPAPSQPSRTPAPGSTSPPAPPADPSGPTSPSTPTPGPGRSISPADPDGVIGQPGPNRPASPPPPSPLPSGSSTSDSPTAHDDQHDDGVDLPGGWITLPLAVALSAAAALVWLRRRHRWVPEPIDAEPDDHDLQPPPPVVTRIRRTVRTKNPSLLPPAEPASQLGSDDQAPAADRGDDAPVVLPPIGPSGVELAGLDSIASAGGLGLTGPGAPAAARALLVATLSAGGPGDPDACGHVVIPADALTTMLGTQAVDLTGIPRLTVAASLPDALARIEEILIERRRILLDHGVEDLDGIRAADPYYPPMPPILLIAETPPALVAARVASTLQLGTPLQISGILLGGWQGANLTISADGHSGNSGQPRLSVLDLPTTMDLLGVLREAHTGAPVSPAPREGGPAAADVFTGPPADEGEPSPATSELTEPARVASTRATGRSPETIPEPLAGTPTNPGDDPPRRAGGENEPTDDPPPAVGPVVVIESDHRLRARVRVLGPPSIRSPEGNPVPAVRHHAQQLLVYLVVFRPGAERARICRAFWPAAEQRLAGGSLNTEASELRRYIRQAIGDSSVNPIINPGGRYILNPDTVNVDAWTLVDALQEAKTAPTPEAKITALRQAVEAHTGILAEGCDYDWIAESRERMRRRGIRARLGLADLIAESEPERAADLLRTAANLDPYSDDLARRALRAYARLGNVEAIRRQLDQLRTALEEINEQPTDETTHLASALVRQLTGSEKRPSRHDASYDTE